jgi:hypothetical protein
MSIGLVSLLPCQLVNLLTCQLFSHLFPDLVLTSFRTCPALLPVFRTFHRRTWENPGRKVGEVCLKVRMRSEGDRKK